MTHARHRAPTPAELQTTVAQQQAQISLLEINVRNLTDDNQRLRRQVHHAVAERNAAGQRADTEADKTARRDAEIRRLRAALTEAQHALADARPRITLVPAAVRPYTTSIPGLTSS